MAKFVRTPRSFSASSKAQSRSKRFGHHALHAAANHDYTVFLKKRRLKGARIGIPRTGFYDKFTAPGGDNAARRNQS